MKALILLTVVSLSGCAGYSKVTERWNALKETAEYKKERALFYSRLGVERICWDTGIYEILLNGDSPNRKCLYPSSRLVRTEGASLGQKHHGLKVFQALPQQGFLVHAEYYSDYGFKRNSDRNAFIVHSDEDNVVDNDYLDATNDEWASRLYSYQGPYTYKSVSGAPITIHSFKKISGASLKKATEGLKAYSYLTEAIAINRAWAALEE